jgi:hypothetical protein
MVALGMDGRRAASEGVGMAELGELGEHVERLKELQGALLDPYVVLDAQRRVVAFHRAFVAMFPRKVSRGLEGRPLHEVLSFRLGGALFDPARECLERGGPVRYDEIEGLGAEDLKLNLIVAAAPLKTGERIVGVLLTVRDVTDQVQIQAKYRSMVGEEDAAKDGREALLTQRTAALMEAQDALMEAQERLSRYARGLEVPPWSSFQAGLAARQGRSEG